MAAGADDAGPPRERVKDVVQHFRAVKRFSPDQSRTHVTSLDFDDTGELAIASRSDDTLQIYNIKEGKHAKELKSQKYGVDLARFSHHSQSVIYASTKVDDTIRYLSTHDNSYIRYFRGHKGRVTCLTMCPSNDDFLSCGLDNTVHLWNVQTPNARGILNLHGATLAAYDPSATVIAVASGATHSILLYDLRNFDKQPFATFDLLEAEQRWDPQARGRSWSGLHFSNDGKNMLLSTTGAGHYIIDSFEGNVRAFARRPAPSTRRPASDLAQQTTRMSGQGDACFSPDGAYLLGGSGSDDGILVWDVREGERTGGALDHFAQLPPPEGKRDRAELVAYNPRFNMLCSADRALMMWLPDKELYAAST